MKGTFIKSKNIIRFFVVFMISIVADLSLKGQVYKTGDFEHVIASPVPNMTFPQFKGGKAGLNQYLKDFVDPSKDTNSKQDRKGVIVLDYKVNSKGKVVEVKIDKTNSTMNQAFNRLLIDALTKSGPWKPGMRNGKPFIAKLQVSFCFD